MIPRLAAFAMALFVAASASAQEQRPRPPRPAQPAHPAAPATPPAPAAQPRETAPPAPPVPGIPPPVRHEGQPVNVRVELTITEQQSSGTPTKKSVTLVVADGESGAARSDARVQPRTNEGFRTLPLNVDVQPRIVDSNRIRVRVVLHWAVLAESKNPGDSPGTTEVTEQIAPILESGKPLIVAQSADPVSDRQVTVEAKATILR